jgi:phosphatidylglycerophosphatase A
MNDNHISNLWRFAFTGGGMHKTKFPIWTERSIQAIKFNLWLSIISPVILSNILLFLCQIFICICYGRCSAQIAL